MEHEGGLGGQVAGDAVGWYSRCAALNRPCQFSEWMLICQAGVMTQSLELER